MMLYVFYVARAFHISTLEHTSGLGLPERQPHTR